MTRQIRVLRRAQLDLLEIQDYIARDNPAAADDEIEAILDLIASLAEFPERGHVPKDAILKASGYRCLRQGEYLVFYKVLRSQVRVYRVVHGRRRYEDIL
ncbi:MAG: type II toxin-antitoxin system RelE/ParE family toxin [Deltaproteobacteria bacterium]|nr:type II toxin-antitoxin system RelE/ParE family toxin [Deltaproteobacteria bacterium]